MFIFTPKNKNTTFCSQQDTYYLLAVAGNVHTLVTYHVYSLK